MPRNLTQKEVLERFKKVHGDKYNYSLVDYKGSGKKVIIVCPIHSDFAQEPVSHWLGSGCPDCGNIKTGNFKKDLKEKVMFITKAHQVVWVVLLQIRFQSLINFVKMFT